MQLLLNDYELTELTYVIFKQHLFKSHLHSLITLSTYVSNHSHQNKKEEERERSINFSLWTKRRQKSPICSSLVFINTEKCYIVNIQYYIVKTGFRIILVLNLEFSTSL